MPRPTTSIRLCLLLGLALQPGVSIVRAEMGRMSGPTTPLGQRVSVLGQVKWPGAVDLAEAPTLAAALMKCGGLTDRAQADRVRVTRRTDEEHTTTLYVDASSIEDPNSPAARCQLHAGDVVYVLVRKK